MNLALKTLLQEGVEAFSISHLVDELGEHNEYCPSDGKGGIPTWWSCKWRSAYFLSQNGPKHFIKAGLNVLCTIVWFNRSRSVLFFARLSEV